MPQNDEEFVSVFDDLFVAGAAHQELSAAERAAAARHAQVEERRQDRRQRRERRRGRMPAGKVRAVVVLVLLAGGYLWLQQDRSKDVQDGAVSEGPQSVRLVYAVPSDQQTDDRLPAAARVEMGIVQGWFAEQTGGRTLRLDQSDGLPTLDVVELSYDATELSQRSDAAALVAEDLTAYEEEHPDVIVVAFVPIIFDAQVRCGESSGGTAVVWVGSCGDVTSADSLVFGDGTTVTIAHELVHVLGGVYECAPHYGRNGHVTDNPGDLMYEGPGKRSADQLILDPGRDDYYDTDIDDCWDVSDHPAWT